MFSFISLKDIADIIIMSFLVYQLYSWFKNTKALQVVIGLASLGLVYVVTKYFGLFMTSWILQEIGTVLFILIIVVFQAEIRQALYRFSLLRNMFGRQESGPQIELGKLAAAVFSLAASNTGAIIVFQRREPLDEYLLHGVPLDSLLSSQLIGSIFMDGTPLHDGAVVIRDGRIALASCHLPLSTNSELPHYYGTRHRAGIGLTERSDAIVIIVSEEMGQVSLAQGGELQIIRKQEELTDTLHTLLAPPEPEIQKVSIKQRIFSNLWPKLATVLLVVGSWLIITSRQGGVITVAAPIKFHNLPDNLALINNVPEQVEVQLKVFSSLVPSPRPEEIVADLDLSRLKEGQNTVPVSDEDFKLPLGMKVSGVKPSVVKVLADKKVRKTLRVRVSVTGELPDGYELRRLKAEPVTVMVEGPENILLMLQSVQTEDIDLTGIWQSVTLERRLITPAPQVRFLREELVKVRVVTGQR